MIAIWFAFAPIPVGGVASYIIVIGNSMEPKFHRGDLVIAHQQASYQTGDAIVYENRELRNFVFHRIVSQQLGHYTLKGDNNSWVDTYQPSTEEVIGKLWLYIPGGGTVVQQIRQPFIMAVLAGLLGTLLVSGLFTNKKKGNKRMNNKFAQEWFTAIKPRIQSWFTIGSRPELNESLSLYPTEAWEQLFFVLGLVMLLSLILAVIAFSRPLSRLTQEEITYEHLGIFSYSAATVQSIYDAGMLKSGDPVFTKLTCVVDVSFQYSLLAGQTANVVGTHQLTAIFSEPVGGWQRSVPLEEETSFSGSTLSTIAKLDLCQMESLAKSLEQETDFHPGSYTLIITPKIHLEGDLANRKFEDVFSPHLTFRYDRSQFYLVREEQQDNPLAFTETGILRQDRQETNTALFLGQQIPIPTLRLIALLALVGSGGGLFLLGFRLRHLCQVDQSQFFRVKYASMIIDVPHIDSIRSTQTIDVSAMDDLARMAERSGAVIWHIKQDSFHIYSLELAGITYRFQISANRKGSTLPETTHAPIRQEDKL